MIKNFIIVLLMLALTALYTKPLWMTLADTWINQQGQIDELLERVYELQKRNATHDGSCAA